MEKPSESLPEIEYWEGFDERRAYEMTFRGYVAGLFVVTPDGKRHPVYFTDLARLAQDLEGEINSGDPFFAEKGMIVLKEVTKANIETAVAALWRQGYFDN